MTIGDFKRERSRRRTSELSVLIDQGGRSSRRRRRRGTFWSLVLASILLLIAAAPSLICQSPLAKTLFQQRAPAYAIEGSFESIRFGWLTPLRLTGLDLRGTGGGTHLRIDQLDSGVTLLRCIGGLGDSVSVSARGVHVELAVDDHWSSIEADWEACSAARDSAEDSRRDDSGDLHHLPEYALDVQNLSVRITDRQTGAVWAVDQARVEADVTAGQLETRLSAILSQPQAGSGSIDAVVRCELSEFNEIQAELNLQGLPLGVASLIRRRMSDVASAIPQRLSGDATGSVRIIMAADGVWSLAMSPLELRNLMASDPSLGEQVWRNGLAVAQGAASIDANGFSGKGLRVTTDFADLSLDGALSRLAAPPAVSSLTTWLTALEGTATVSIDLVAMTESLPGIIPLRDETRLVSGGIIAEITSQGDTPGTRRIHGNFQSQPLRARAAGRNVVIEPAALVASLRINDSGLWQADRCQLTSSFGSATLDGDLSRGRATADLDLGRLAAMLEPLVDLPELSLGGAGAGEMQWSAQAGNQWRLQGDGDATDLTIGLPGGIQLHRPTLAVHVDASGRWDGKTLRELTAAEVSLRSHLLEADASLLTSVSDPSLETALPLRVNGRGRLEVLAEFLSPWLPESLHSLQGGFNGQAHANVSLAGGQLTAAKIALQEPRGGWKDRLYSQSELAIDFAGNYAWPANTLIAESLKLTGEAISAVATGMISADAIDCELTWRATLDALQGSAQPLLAADLANTRRSGAADGGGNIRGVAFTNPTRFAPAATPSDQTPGQWTLTGNCEGRLIARRPSGGKQIALETHAQATELAVLQPADASAGHQTIGPQLPPSRWTASGSANRRDGGAVVWAEPSLQLDGVLLYDLTDGHLDANKLQLASEWFATTLSGAIQWNDRRGAIELSGPARLRMPQVATQLTALAGTPIRLEGIHETPVQISVNRQDDDSVKMRITANLGWEAGEIAGVVFGPSSIPVVMSETTVSIQPATIPVDQGRIHVAGDVHYRPGTLWMNVKPGVIAQNLRLTPELSERWLQYLAPMVAQATRIDGTFGIDLSEALINLEEPTRSRVRGQLQISQIDFDSGPMANQLLSSIQQIQMIARGKPLPEANPPAEGPAQTRRIATLPTQSVDFDLSDGVITHQRMFMEIDRAHLVTSGQVHIDGRLNLITQVPLDAAWLGNDLKTLAGRTVTLPVGGTLSRPRLDAAAIRDLVGQVGSQAIQATAENYLEKQLNRGLDRLLGK